ncbi:MAG: ABC transporter permease [Chthoniobacterales bacterium]|nr:MAG: ABC transporter permease [Chthoniobacterales bacterium]
MLNDIRYAFRQLIKSPGFTAVTVLTLALGIGACTAIFSVVNVVLLRPLDYPEPGRIVVIRETNFPEFPEFSVSPPNYLDWEKQTKSYEKLAAYSGSRINLTGDGEPQQLVGIKATAQYFDVYGIKPALGRTFLPEEDAPGKNHVAVLSYPFWQRVFGGAADVIGRPIQLNGEPYTVVGVAPLGFGVASRVDAWMPMAFEPKEVSNDARGGHYLNVVGRLKPGVTVAQAEAELKVLAAQLAQQYPDSNKGWGIFMMPLQDFSVRDVRTVLYTLLGAVGCVLLIACANIANLLLARATARHREISIRAALGASRARLIRQLLTESVMLALCGGLAGVLFARWGLDALLALAPPNLPRVSDIHLDAGVLIFSLGLSVITGLVFGIAPAWLAARADVNEALKQGSRGSTEGGARGRLRSALVILEVTFALMLLGGAGLLARSFMQLAHVDPGFTPENATVLRLSLPQKKYALPEQQTAFADTLLERVKTLPGVQAVGLTHSMPLVGDYVLGFNIEGRAAVAPSDLPSTNYYAVTPDYFRAMGIRLVRGRVFTARDDAKAPRVAVINEMMARQHFPNEDPIGKRINITNGPDTWREIIGIVGDIKQYGVDKATSSQSYEPFAQVPFGSLNVVIRTGGSPAALLGAIRPAVYAVDKDQPIGAIRPLEEIMADSIARQRFAMTLLTVFSLVALVIAAVGIYGVMAYSVVQRTGEFGIRMALGAQQRDVLRLVLAQGGKLVGIGLVIGLAATLAASRAMGSMLFNTSAQDPLTLGTITLVLAVVALIACLLPASRATKVNPIEALRAE